MRYKDDKAARIVMAFAFLTAAATTLFVWAAGRSAHPEWRLPGRAVDLVLVSFAAFFVFTFLGTLFILSAIGPRFNWPQQWARDSKIKSRLFFLPISDVPEDVWLQHLLHDDVNGLEREYLKDLAQETLLSSRERHV